MVRHPGKPGKIKNHTVYVRISQNYQQKTVQITHSKLNSNHNGYQIFA